MDENLKTVGIKKSRKKVYLYITMFALIVLLFASGFLFIGNQPFSPTTLSQPGWTAYNADKLDITFDYPNYWSLPAKETYFKTDQFKIKFDTNSGDTIIIYGNNNPTEVIDYMQPYFGMCSQINKSLEQFCSRGDCVKVNENTKLYFDSKIMGERVNMVYVYSQLSDKYPFLCAEATLNGMPANIVSVDDIQKYIASSIVDENMRIYISDLVDFAESITKSAKINSN